MTSIERPKCGSCGAELPGRFAQARMITCESCGTSSVLRDQAFETAGSGGEMLDAPSLIRLGQSIVVRSLDLMPVGHARFSYGRGWWDEFWCIDGYGEGHWLSADEGDYALERDLSRDHWPKSFRPRLGAETEILGQSFTISEAETASSIAVRGEFPEELEVGEAHLYFDLSGENSAMATYEKWDGGEAWSIGQWVDPWDVTLS
ncbi:DUF4178 domain-containing protein [Rhodobacteraceae bacterium]|nr:DUF4178 domain-containing protein [Paracoccaceae bacterium]